MLLQPVYFPNYFSPLFISSDSCNLLYEVKLQKCTFDLKTNVYNVLHYWVFVTFYPGDFVVVNLK